MTRNDAMNGWAKGLPEVKRCLNSESKVTRKTPFELWRGYRARFRLGTLREVTTSSDNWTMPQELWDEARDQLERSKSKTKAAFDTHRDNNTNFTVGEIVVMRLLRVNQPSCRTATGVLW